MTNHWKLILVLRAVPLYGTLFLSLITVGATRAEAAVVRGRLVRQSQPASGIAVTVYSPKTKRTIPVRTDSSGSYYIPNVAPGDYTLEVWTSTGAGAQPTTFPITVTEPYTDNPTFALH